MKAVLILLLAVCYVHCRKTYQPLDKNANLAFINMEGGGGARPGSPSKPAAQPAPVNPPVNVAPAPKPIPAPAPKPAVVTPKPVSVVTPPVPAAPKPAAPAPTQIKPVPVNPKPVVNPITTPGPGSVKQLVNFYDSQGKASPIRPYSYSHAVKQG